MNLYDYLDSTEQEIPETVICPQCSRVDHPGCMKSLHEETEGPAFVCGTCWTDNERARIATEEAALPPADPWTSDDERGKWVRAERTRLLSQCDWTELPSRVIALGETAAAAWATYRQALRDLPDVYETPADVIWPTAPGGS